MRIIHRVANDFSAAQKKVLAQYGIDVKVGIDAFEIDEADPRWIKLQPIIRNCMDLTRTVFTASELKASRLFAIECSWHYLYPEPSDDFGYREITYDLSVGCELCGIGWRQKAPFRLRREPRWKNRWVFHLNWVFDELFVRPEVWATVFKPFGIGCRRVINHRTGTEVDTVVQLDIPHIAESRLIGIPNDHPAERCEKCGRSKYHPFTRGFFPPFEREPTVPICKTQEYFGSGGQAWRAVVISSGIFKSIRNHNPRGLIFHPLAKTVEELTYPLA